MGRSSIWSAVLLSALVAAAGCTPTARNNAGRASKSEPYDFKTEGTIPAAQPEEVVEQADVVEVPVSDDVVDVQEAEAPRDTTPPESATPQAVAIDGFRVQVFASASREAAEGARRTAHARLGKSAYVEFLDGLYKVRVGNCRTRECAEALLKEVRGNLYKDAWIVETKIEVPLGSEGTQGG